MRIFTSPQISLALLGILGLLGILAIRGSINGLEREYEGANACSCLTNKERSQGDAEVSELQSQTLKPDLVSNQPMGASPWEKYSIPEWSIVFRRPDSYVVIESEKLRTDDFKHATLLEVVHIDASLNVDLGPALPRFSIVAHRQPLSVQGKIYSNLQDLVSVAYPVESAYRPVIGQKDTSLGGIPAIELIVHDRGGEEPSLETYKFIILFDPVTETDYFSISYPTDDPKFQEIAETLRFLDS